METKHNWKPWTREAYFTINKGRYLVKYEDGSIHYDDFKYRGPILGWGFSIYTEKHIVEYSEF